MSNQNSIEKKIRTIRFVTLSFILFLFADIIGRLFFLTPPPYILRIATWLDSLFLAFISYYGLKRIDRPTWKLLSSLLFYTLYIVTLILSRFYSFTDYQLIGYRVSITVLPLIVLLLDLYGNRTLKWYGRELKRILHLPSSRDFRFYIGFAILLLIPILLAIWGYNKQGTLSGFGKNIYQLCTEGEINNNTDKRDPYRRYSSIFNDMNSLQLEAAKRNGLKGEISSENIEQNRQLVKIESCNEYYVDRLTHSVPYLVPKAAKLVEDIGKAFQDSLYRRGYHSSHRVIVTSVLRTSDHIKSLKKVNVNATENSCHTYGTTVDISYTKFKPATKGNIASEAKMRDILMQVIYDMRQQERCYVKYEKQQACLHITVR